MDEAQRILVDNKTDLDDFGRLLDHTWRLKRQTGKKISTGSIDELYTRAMNAGALGGKLLGAGGGGFLLFYVPADKRTAVMKALDGYMYVPFEFENNGTQVIYYAPETYEMSGSRRGA